MFKGHRVQIKSALLNRQDHSVTVPNGTWGEVISDPRMGQIQSAGVDLKVRFDNGVETYVEPMDLYDPEFPETSPDYEP